jgi:hypothetical protein
MALQPGSSNGSGPVGTFGTPTSATNDIDVNGNFLNGDGTTPNGNGGVVKPNQCAPVRASLRRSPAVLSTSARSAELHVTRITN